MKTFVAICLFMILAFVVLLFRLTVSTFVTGEKALIYKSQTGTKVFFQRTRSALASAEYERSLIVVSNGGKTTRFHLRIDGGDVKNTRVSKHRGKNGGIFIGIWDSSKSLDYLVDVEAHMAFSVLCYENEVGTLPQYAPYRDSPSEWTKNEGAVLASTKEEVLEYIRSGTKVLLLEDLIDMHVVFLGTLVGRTGPLTFKSELVDSGNVK